MKDMLRYRYAIFPNQRLKLKHSPIGIIALKYMARVILDFLRSSTKVVKFARNWVAMVAHSICHVVRIIGKGYLSRIHLLKTMMSMLSNIHALQISR